METTSAILLRKTKLSDTSLIITWLTESHGKVKTVAKGARQPKSRFAGRLDLFFLCEVSFLRSRKSELHTLREVELREAFEGVRKDYDRLNLAAYFVELIELVTEPDHAVPELYELLFRGIRYLHTENATRRALEHFEKELTRVLGIEHPNVASHVSLGRAYHRLPNLRQTVLQRL